MEECIGLCELQWVYVTDGCCYSLSLLLSRRVYRLVVVAAAVVRVLSRRDLRSRSAEDISSRCRLMPLIGVSPLEVQGDSGTASSDRELFPLSLNPGALIHLHAGVGATAFVRTSVNTGNVRLVTGSVTYVLEAWLHSYGIARGGALTGF